MEGNGGNEENDFPSSHGRGVGGGRRYAPVVAHDNDRAVLEMSSLESAAAAASSSSSPFPTRNPPNIKVVKNLNFVEEGSLPTHEGVNGSQTDSKLMY